MGNFVTNEEVMNKFKKIDDEKEKLTNNQIKLMHEEIIDNSKFLVYKVTRKYRSFSNYEDLVQEGFKGLLVVTRKFNYKLFPNFYVYAERCIRRHVNRAASRFDIVYSADKKRTVYSDSPLECARMDTEHETPESLVEKKQLIDKINNEISKFKDRDSDIVKRIFGLDDYNPHTLREIEPVHNISYEGARLIKNKIINQVKKALK